MKFKNLRLNLGERTTRTRRSGSGVPADIYSGAAHARTRIGS
jgi:hypothetical protein